MKKTAILLILLTAFIFFKGRAQKPNVIYILTDQWRASAVGYNGNEDVKTPHIDKFSEEAVIFKNAVSVCPVCTPYRASLMTGRFPTTTGMFINDLYLPREELCMAEIYQAVGYQTAYFGKWHLDGHGRYSFVQPYRRQGFEHWVANECSHSYNNMPYYKNQDMNIKYWNEYSPFAIGENAGKYLDELSEEKDPFLLFISFATPHFPHQTALEEYKQMYPESELKLRENVDEEQFAEVRTELQGYYAHCTATDKAFGDLMNKIKDLGLFNNSIIVFTSDHGEMMGSHGISPRRKQMAWDESIEVPFLISYPDISNNKGKEVYTPINTPDILPTMLSLSDIEIPRTIEGDDLSSVVRNPDKQKDRSVLFMNVSPFAGAYRDEGYRGIKTKQYTYVKSLDRPVMLYDNEADPFQMNNLADKPQFAKLQNKLNNLLEKELKEIGDPFKGKDYYLNKWKYQVTKSYSIAHTYKPGEETIVQTPYRQPLE